MKEALKEEYPDSIDFDDTDLDKFKDTYLQVFNNIMVFDWFDVETGIVYHYRKALDKATMQQYNMPTSYRSLAQQGAALRHQLRKSHQGRAGVEPRLRALGV